MLTLECLDLNIEEPMHWIGFSLSSDRKFKKPKIKFNFDLKAKAYNSLHLLNFITYTFKIKKKFLKF